MVEIINDEDSLTIRSNKRPKSRAYSIILIPLSGDGKAIYLDKDYTTSAKKHNVILGGITYYIRQDGQENEDLSNRVQISLEKMFGDVRITKPVRITLEELE